MNKKQHSKKNSNKSTPTKSYLKKSRIGKILIILFVGAVFVFFSFEMLINNERLFSKLNADKQSLLTLYLNMIDETASAPVETQLIDNFNKNFRTRRDYYPIIAKNNKLIFVMNEHETELFVDYTLSHYLNQNNMNAVAAEYNFDSKIFENIRLEDNNLFNVILDSINIGKDVYTIGICASEGYYYDNYRMWIHNRYVIASFIVTIIIVFCYTFTVNENNKKLSKENEDRRINEIATRKKLENQIEINRQLSKNTAGDGRSLYPRDFLETVTKQLTNEQKEKAVVLIIEDTTEDFQTSAIIASLLERISSKNIISCVGTAHNFVVLMLNATKDDAEVFKYKFSIQLREYTIKDLHLPSIYISNYFENESFEAKENK